MIKKLTPIGNSLGLIIDRPILNLLNIDRDTELEIKTDGQTLTIRPVKEGTERGETEAAIPERNRVVPKETGKSFLDELRDAFK